ncbi:MAG: hypothetical protein JXA82_19470 [Sedimentisphaerales bacterium]|nr:hypothetical protein [Sedimentisphaerales bacterium]
MSKGGKRNRKISFWLKGIIFLFLIVGAFLAGYFSVQMKGFLANLAYPKIKSDTDIRYDHYEWSSTLPENAHHLYSAKRGFVDAHHYFAFSLDSRDECETWLEKEADLSIDHFLPQTNHWLHVLFRHGPDFWESKYQDDNWQLAKETKFLVAEGAVGRVFAYVPDKCRIYILWGCG